MSSRLVDLSGSNSPRPRVPSLNSGSGTAPLTRPRSQYDETSEIKERLRAYENRIAMLEGMLREGFEAQAESVMRADRTETYADTISRGHTGGIEDEETEVERYKKVKDMTGIDADDEVEDEAQEKDEGSEEDVKGNHLSKMEKLQEQETTMLHPVQSKSNEGMKKMRRLLRELDQDEKEGEEEQGWDVLIDRVMERVLTLKEELSRSKQESARLNKELSKEKESSLALEEELSMTKEELSRTKEELTGLESELAEAKKIEQVEVKEVKVQVDLEDTKEKGEEEGEDRWILPSHGQEAGVEEWGMLCRMSVDVLEAQQASIDRLAQLPPIRQLLDDGDPGTISSTTSSALFASSTSSMASSSLHQSSENSGSLEKIYGQIIRVSESSDRVSRLTKVIESLIKDWGRDRGRLQGK